MNRKLLEEMAELPISGYERLCLLGAATFSEWLMDQGHLTRKSEDEELIKLFVQEAIKKEEFKQ